MRCRSEARWAFARSTLMLLTVLVRAFGCEVIFITPHFTRPAMMNFRTLRECDQRPC